MSAAQAECQRLSAAHEMERTAAETQRLAEIAREKVVVEQLSADRARLEGVIRSGQAESRQLAAELARERKARKQAEATRGGHTLASLASLMHAASADLSQLASTMTSESTGVLKSLPSQTPMTLEGMRSADGGEDSDA